jgi:nicotinate phosphoribosyltransferase
MAHSFVQAHEHETEAFEHFARSRPRASTLLIDTYDTEAAARSLIPLSQKLAREGISIQGVRIDSGDLAEHGRRVRSIFDAGGLSSVKIFASGNLDEYKLEQIVNAGAPIDGFGVGTRMNTSADAPYLDCAYKLQEYGGVARRKRSEGKATWPGRKQVYRGYGAAGRMSGGSLTTEDDIQAGTPLLLPVMAAGRRLGATRPLEAIREHAMAGLLKLPEALRVLVRAPSYAVTVSAALKALTAAVDQRTGKGLP